MGPSDYVLLELLNRLDGVQGRKKLQKLVYIAKVGGLPIEDDYVFHYYGPYSSGLASRVDHLVEAKLLEETKRELGMPESVEYGYKVTSKARKFLASVHPSVPEPFRKKMERGLGRAVELKDRDVFQLELGATLLYWRENGHTWEEAEEATAQCKNTDRNSDVFKAARTIAREAWTAREQARE